MSMTHCPLCRARLERAAECPRCGADLRLAQGAQRQAAGCLSQALKHFATGDLAIAEIWARRALALHRTPLAEWVVDRVCQRTHGRMLH